MPELWTEAIQIYRVNFEQLASQGTGRAEVGGFGLFFDNCVYVSGRPIWQGSSFPAKTIEPVGEERRWEEEAESINTFNT